MVKDYPLDVTPVNNSDSDRKLKKITSESELFTGDTSKWQSFTRTCDQGN